MSETPSLDKTSPPSPSEAAALLDRVQSEVRRVIVGQDRAIERLMVALLSKGHVLLEGVPGLAKTLAAETLSRTVVTPSVLRRTNRLRKAVVHRL